MVCVAKIKWKEWRDNHEGEEYHEIGKPHLHIVGVPKFLCMFHIMYVTGMKVFMISFSAAIAGLS